MVVDGSRWDGVATAWAGAVRAQVGVDDHCVDTKARSKDLVILDDKPSADLELPRVKARQERLVGGLLEGE